jgi:hypothetical protein
MNDEIEPIARWRKLLFRCGIVAAALSTVSAIFCWHPFPLVPWGDGGYRTNPWDEHLFVGSVCVSSVTVILPFFGRGFRRVLLISIGLLLFVLSVFGYVFNHVV